MMAGSTAGESRRLKLRRGLIASVAAVSLTVSGLAVGVSGASAAPLNVRGDSDSIHDLVTGVTTNYPNSGSASENIESLRDRNPATKWYAGTGNYPTVANPIWAIYTLSSSAVATGYSITSGNDAPERDPKNWTVLGSNNADAASNSTHASWVEIDNRSNASFDSRRQRAIYSANNSTAYKYYQLRVTANRAGSSTADNNTKFQISDWTLRTGTPGYSPNIISGATTWSYLEDGTIDPAGGDTVDRTKWTRVGATLPGTWKSAAGPFGAKRDGANATPNVGANFPVNTLLKYFLSYTDNANYVTVPAYFFRYEFELDQAAVNSIKGLYGTLVHDDAATVFVNGEPVADFPGTNVPTGNLGYGGNNDGDPATKQLLFPTTDLLQVGTNVISVELHNVNATSSDVYFAMPSLAATSDTVAVPFTPAELAAAYPSDVQPVGDTHPDYFINQLLNYSDLEAHHPNILSNNKQNGPVYTGGGTIPRTEGLVSANDRVTVTINNVAATDGTMQAEKRAQANADNSGFSTQRMSNGLGTVLGPIFDQALTSGELPKTYWLLNGRIEVGRDHEPAKAYYDSKRPFNRLGFINASDNPCGGSGSLQGTYTGAGRIEKTLTTSYGLCDNGSLPSGHTNHGFAQGTALATLLPELSPQIMYRASEYGNSRIVLGYHYALDVMTGRMAGNATAAQRWDDPAFADLLEQAKVEIHDVLSAKCVAAGHDADVRACAEEGDLLTDQEALDIYQDRMTYSAYLTADGVRHTDGFTRVYDENRYLPINMPAEAPAILKSAYPDLTTAERATILRATALEGGWAFDRTADGGESWQRLNFAAAMAANVTRSGDKLIVNSIDTTVKAASDIKVGGVSLTNFNPQTTSYTVTLPVGTTAVPAIDATKSAGSHGITVQAPSGLPGVATVTVTALDGTTTTYQVQLTVAEDTATIAELATLDVNGSALVGFDPAQLSYLVELPTGTTAAPVVTATAAHGGSVEITQATSPNGAATIKVTSQNGETTKTYVLYFAVKPPTNGGNPGDQPVVAAVGASVKAVRYNTAARVNVTVAAAGTVAQGRVVVRKGSKQLGAAALSGGKATVTLPRTLAVGSHRLSVTYVPTAGGKVAAPAKATVITLRVAKVKAKAPAVKIVKGKRNAKTIKRGVKATVRVTLKGVGAAKPTGTVRLRVGKTVVGKAKVRKSGKKYIATVKTKRVTKKGKVSIVYSGNKSLSKATYKTKLTAR